MVLQLTGSLNYTLNSFPPPEIQESRQQQSSCRTAIFPSNRILCCYQLYCSKKTAALKCNTYLTLDSGKKNKAPQTSTLLRPFTSQLKKKILPSKILASKIQLHMSHQHQLNVALSLLLSSQALTLYRVVLHVSAMAFPPPKTVSLYLSSQF